MVFANQLGVNLEALPVGEVQLEAGLALGIGGQGRGQNPLDGKINRQSHVQVGFLPLDTEVGDGGRSPGNHPLDPVVVLVETQAGSYALSHFALGLLGILDTTELTGVGTTHLKNQAEIRLNHVGQVLDVAYPVSSHLNNQVAGVFLSPKDGQRHAHLTIEGANGGQGLTLAREQGS